MMVTGKTMAAVTPQISIAPQPPMSSTDHPSDPSRKPGFARQMTNPSYQRSVLRSCRSSTTASATVYLLLVRQIWDRAAKVTPVSKTFNALQSVRDAQASDHDQMRVRRVERRGLRRIVAL